MHVYLNNQIKLIKQKSIAPFRQSIHQLSPVLSSKDPEKMPKILTLSLDFDLIFSRASRSSLTDLTKTCSY